MKVEASARATASLKTLLALDVSDCDLQLFFGARAAGKNDSTLREAILSKSLASSMKEIVDDCVAKLRARNEAGDLEIVEYISSGHLDTSELGYIDPKDAPEIVPQLKALLSAVAPQILDLDPGFVEDLVFYAFSVRSAGNRKTVFLRVYSPGKELTHSKLFGITLSGEEFTKLEERVFLMDKHIDCIATQDSVFVLNAHNFVRIFDYQEAIVESAKKTLYDLKKSVRISNFAEFQADCEQHPQKLMKLQNIAKQPYFATLTTDDLVRAIKYNKLDIKVVGKGNVAKLVYDPTKKWDLLRLLDDDYLWSRMTSIKYRANSKRTL